MAAYVTLTRGEYDDLLQWPFKGDVIVDFVTRRKTRDTMKTLLSLKWMVTTDSMAATWMNVNWDVICSSPTKQAP